MQTVLFESDEFDESSDDKETKPEKDQESKPIEVVSLHERFMIQKYGEDWKHNEHFIKKRRHR